jgi:mono/diheme cytochrome c family protein
MKSATQSAAWNPAWKRLALAALLFASSATSMAQVAGQWKNPEFLFKRTCAYCHDQSVVKGVGPEILGRNLSAEMVVAFMRAGPNAMPAFSEAQISPAEAQALGVWIRDSRQDSLGRAK